MSANASHAEKAAENWVSYRPEIRVLDCTIRDGGLMNDHRFDDAVVREVYKACVAAGIDYMEVGYKASRRVFDPADYGPWKFCAEEDVRRIVGDNDTDLKLAVMADAEKTDYEEDILPADESVIDMVRVATYIHQIPTAMDMLSDAHAKGYETCANIMAVTNVSERELVEGIEMLAESGTRAIYIVDSFGALYRERLDYLYDMYAGIAEPKGIEIGIHMHNNLQLGFANTVEGIIKGANMLDATMAGLGRGAGNCPMELLLGFLHNPKYHLRPVVECVSGTIEPLRAKLGWGFDIPYMMTGFLNRHPRAAMKFKEEPDGDVMDFLDRLLEEA